MCAFVLSLFSHVRLFVTPMDYTLPGSYVHGFSRQEYWSRLLCPPPGHLPDPGIEPASLMSSAFASRFSTTSATWGIHYFNILEEILFLKISFESSFYTDLPIYWICWLVNKFYFLFYILATPRSLQDLSFWIKDWTEAPGSGSMVS